MKKKTRQNPHKSWKHNQHLDFVLGFTPVTNKEKDAKKEKILRENIQHAVEAEVEKTKRILKKWPKMFKIASKIKIFA